MVFRDWRWCMCSDDDFSIVAKLIATWATTLLLPISPLLFFFWVPGSSCALNMHWSPPPQSWAPLKWIETLESLGPFKCVSEPARTSPASPLMGFNIAENWINPVTSTKTKKTNSLATTYSLSYHFMSLLLNTLYGNSNDCWRIRHTHFPKNVECANFLGTIQLLNYQFPKILKFQDLG